MLEVNITHLRSLSTIKKNLEIGRLGSSFLLKSIGSKLLTIHNSLLHSKSLEYFGYNILSEGRFHTCFTIDTEIKLLKKLNLDPQLDKLMGLTTNQSKMIMKLEKYIERKGILTKDELEMISGYVFVNTDCFNLASIPHSMGLIFIGKNFWKLNVEDMVISICHELGHQDLFLINTIDRIVAVNFDKRICFAPLQKRNRPPIGRIHSYFALHRMLLASLYLKNTLRAKQYENLFNLTYNTFVSKELTAFGEDLIKLMHNSIVQKNLTRAKDGFSFMESINATLFF